ncbi:hypothetical protein [Rhodopirellula halodulae]|uniref:hypothetical protein n=1 Tax=Rhodopirellula halodulae TaxID=2894198 RepID=UPI001E547173|nr:hypothetical protein [Rhodopirellula sp. JC737]MCC9655607.1 hypothetical protein [Rhodopirellula sp. JC737]
MNIKTIAAAFAIALAAFWLGDSFSNAQPVFEQSGDSQLGSVPAKLKGTYVVSTALENMTMIALVDPEFASIDGTQILKGVVSEKNGFIRDTPFTGGMTYIPVKKIHSIQQLMTEG